MQGPPDATAVQGVCVTTTPQRSAVPARPRPHPAHGPRPAAYATAPWEGEEGLRQQHLGVRNAAALARGFVGEGIEVVVADVLTPDTLVTYRKVLPGCVVVHLTLPLEEARRRAATRPVWLTDAEFVALHHADAAAELAADHVLEVGGLGPAQQAAAVDALWRAGAGGS